LCGNYIPKLMIQLIHISSSNIPVFGRPFVRRFALSYRTVVCLSCSLSVYNIGVLQPNGWMDQDETWHAGLPSAQATFVRWGPSSPTALWVYFLSRTYQLAGRLYLRWLFCVQIPREGSPEIYNKYMIMSHESHKDNGKTVRDGIPLTTFSQRLFDI